MTKVEIDGKTYCVETLIYTVKRLTKEVKTSAELHRWVLEKIVDEVNKLKKVSDGNSVYVGINDVFDIIDKYKTERR